MRAWLLTLCLLAVPAMGHAALAEISGSRATPVEWTSADSQTIALGASGATTGHLIVVAGSNWNTGSTTMTVTAPCVSSFNVTQAADQAGAGGVYKLFIARGIATATGACTITIDPQGTGNYGSASATTFSGPDTGTPDDADGGSSSGTGTSVSDSITTATANAAIVGVFLHDSGGSETMTAGGSYTTFGEIESASNAPHHALFRIATTATSYTVDGTLGGSQNWRMQTRSFREATAGANTQFFPRRVQP